jgi:hypothetical protein
MKLVTKQENNPQNATGNYFWDHTHLLCKGNVAFHSEKYVFSCKVSKNLQGH